MDLFFTESALLHSFPCLSCFSSLGWSSFGGAGQQVSAVEYPDGLTIVNTRGRKKCPLRIEEGIAAFPHPI